MHPHLIDWLRQVEIASDTVLAQKRWSAAETYARALTSEQCKELLRLFIFPKPAPTAVKKFSDELVAIDPEFPPSNNTQLVRLMAGIVMVVTLDERSYDADAFALGLRAARLNGTRGQPVQLEIAALAEDYLQQEARSQRVKESRYDKAAAAKKFDKRYEALRQAEAGSDEPARIKTQLAYHQAIVDEIEGGPFISRLGQLTEEVQLLWWVVGAYSPTLKKRMADLSSVEYALVAAGEVEERIEFAVAPLSVEEMIARSLACCIEAPRKKPVTMTTIIAAADSNWRASIIKRYEFADCFDLVPMCTGLQKFTESGDVGATSKTIANLCPGVKPSEEMAPVDAAKQFLIELLFLRTLAEI